MEQRDSRSPIARAPERQAGEALREEFFKAFVNRLLFPIVMVCMVWSLALLEWMRALGWLKSHPVVWTVMAVLLTVGLAFWWWPRVRRQIENLLKGERGERAVGEALAELRDAGYRVVHDVEFEGNGGRRWNVDHVLVGPSGVYVVESKYRSLPANGDATIRFDGSELHFSDGCHDDRWVRQVRRGSAHVGKLVRTTLGIDTFARGVLMVPGWDISGSSGREEWVLKPGALRRWVQEEERRGRQKLTERDRDRIVQWLQELPRKDWLE